MYKKVSTDMNFVEREKEVEKFWEENHIFAGVGRRVRSAVQHPEGNGQIQSQYSDHQSEHPGQRLRGGHHDGGDLGPAPLHGGGADIISNGV